MPIFAGEIQPESVSLSAVVIRADGTREDLGVIAFHHRSLWRRLQWRFSNFIKRLRAL